MLRIKVSSLKEGMIVAEDVFDRGSFPFINEGVSLTRPIIDSLKGKDIHFLYVKVPDGYNSDTDIELYNPKEDLHYRGRVYVKGELRQSLKIHSDKSIILSGTVKEGCSLESKSGNISIKGSIQGTVKDKVAISSRGDILLQEAASITYLNIKALGSVTVDGHMSNCRITAGGNITVQGKVTASSLSSGGRIQIQSCGDGEHECVIEAKPSVTGFITTSRARRIIVTRDIHPATTFIIDECPLVIDEKKFSLVFYLDNSEVKYDPYMGG